MFKINRRIYCGWGKGEAFPTPSTIAGQEKDKSIFFDGSHIRLADMGEIEDLKS